MKYTLAQLAELTQTQLEGDPNFLIVGVDDLENARPEDASFLSNSRYESAMRRSKAGVIFIGRDAPRAEGKNYLTAQDPSRAFQQAIELFYGQLQKTSAFTGIHPTAVIHPTARLAEGVSVGPLSVIDCDVEIAANTTIASHVCIGAGTKIGTDCVIHTRVTIRETCIIKNRVIIQPGAVIGSCGFGYITDQRGHHQKLKQLGNVILEDDVEIGANTTIDRARFKSTIIKRGSKIDNLVQIAHGVVVGEDNLFVAQTGIAGSSKTGRHVIVAGQSGITGHVTLGDGVIITARSGVSKSITEPGKYTGEPAVPMNEHHRLQVQMRQLQKYLSRIQELEKRLADLENHPQHSSSH
jgi:UDP-3-O-[3-hydroxymyristoyl] glucosamine N-acyltransferase